MLTTSEVDALLAKLRVPEPTALAQEDKGTLAGIVESWAHLIELAADKSTSMQQIRRLLGLKPARESTPGQDTASRTASASDNEPPRGAESSSAHEPSAAPLDEERAKNRDAHGRRGPGAFGKLAHAHHAHTSLFAGDACPKCKRGRLYKYRPSEFTTISGQPPLVATRHTVEALQCNLCKEVFKAPLPELLLADGIRDGPLYSYSAVAVVSSFRFFAGMPMHRQDRLQRALGVPVPDASIWDMCERQADALRPIARVLHGLAEAAFLFFGDDTGARILDTPAMVRKNRKTGHNELRTGCHTTCVIAVTTDNYPISLFVTGIHHTGEVMDLIVAARDPSLPSPIFMGDCIASNTVTQAVVLYAGCNAHAVRRFKALVDRYPEQASFVLERYKQIYEHEEHCRVAGMTGEARRDHHRAHSLPLLRAICEYGHELFEGRRVEPSSDLGQALSYVIDNERRLSAFTRHPHAPLDNNRCERELRLCVQLRETARFFRNAIGSGVADTVLTVGATALAAGVNLPDYFVAVQRFAQDVREHPELWLPWCYETRLRALGEHRARPLQGPELPALLGPA